MTIGEICDDMSKVSPVPCSCGYPNRRITTVFAGKMLREFFFRAGKLLIKAFHKLEKWNLSFLVWLREGRAITSGIPVRVQGCSTL